MPKAVEECVRNFLDLYGMTVRLSLLKRKLGKNLLLSDRRFLGVPSRLRLGESLPHVPWIALDVETTGLSVAKGHRIHELALLDDFGGKLEASLLPDRPRARAAALDLGVSPKATRLSALLQELGTFLQRGVVVGHNVVFDLQFLHAEAARAGESLPEIWFVDTMAVAESAGLRGKLSVVARALGLTVSFELLHTASYDARLARSVLLALIERLELTTLKQLRPRRYRCTEVSG